jgi:hypothetical protein
LQSAYLVAIAFHRSAGAIEAGNSFKANCTIFRKEQHLTERAAVTSRAFCSEDVQSSSSGKADAAASGAGAAERAGEDLEVDDEVSAGPDAGADAAAAGFADISVLTVDIKPLASWARKVFTLATTSSGERVPANMCQNIKETAYSYQSI